MTGISLVVVVVVVGALAVIGLPGPLDAGRRHPVAAAATSSLQASRRFTPR
jgi:Tfp pilus assembly protein PilE